MDHIVDNEHEHHHGDGHHHHHDSRNEYFVQQLMTVGICAAFGVVAILMYKFKQLKFILASDFRDPVLWAGICLLLLAVYRGISLWREAGENHGHDHGHDHGHGHNHGHADDHNHNHGHDHHKHEHVHAAGEVCNHTSQDACQHHDHAAADHSHDDHAHGNIYWRLIVLAFPIMLFCMGLPNRTFSNEWLQKRLMTPEELGEYKLVTARAGDPQYDFASLAQAAHSQDRRNALEGTPAIIKGQKLSIPGRPTELRLVYLKMTCCGADAVPLEARIITSNPSLMTNLDIKDYDWIEVTGTIQFQHLPRQNRYLTVIHVHDDGIRKTDPVE